LPLRFACPLCAHIVVTAEHTIGEMFRCPECGGPACVPATAAPTEDAPNLRRYTPPPKQYFEDALRASEIAQCDNKKTLIPMPGRAALIFIGISLLYLILAISIHSGLKSLCIEYRNLASR
jgi:hypothetical protein